jgi:hypothetical protein
MFSTFKKVEFYVSSNINHTKIRLSFKSIRKLLKSEFKYIVL